MTPITGWWFTMKPIETQNMGKACVKFTVPGVAVSVTSECRLNVPS